MKNYNYTALSCLAAGGLYTVALYFLPEAKEPPLRRANREPAQIDRGSNPCTNPFFTVIIDGVMHSGSTRTADLLYRESEQELKEVQAMDDISEERRKAWIAEIKKSLKSNGAFRAFCPKWGESRPIGD